MKNNKYKSLLSKMFIIESLGEAFYNNLCKKTTNNKLKKIYTTLASNELETRKQIEQELLKYNIPNPVLSNAIALLITNLFFYCFPGKILDKTLRKILKRKIYSRWYNLYSSNNIKLWTILLEHENLQHKLLMI